jgi:hypothetical protein
VHCPFTITRLYSLHHYLAFNPQLLPEASERKAVAAATAGIKPSAFGGASTSLTFTSAAADIPYRRVHILATPMEVYII